MNIAIASDHRGVQLKARIVEYLSSHGYVIADAGPAVGDAVDYPDFAAAVGRAVSEGQAERGILICGTGIGMAIAANKFRGVRAATCNDELSAEMSRRHNNLNVLCLSADTLGQRNIDRLLDLWLTTPFDGGRHARRIEKITRLEGDCDEP